MPSYKDDEVDMNINTFFFLSWRDGLMNSDQRTYMNSWVWTHTHIHTYTHTQTHTFHRAVELIDKRIAGVCGPPA